MEKYYITTAIDYASGKGHIGNYYEKVVADVLARFRKKQGYDVLFQLGLDEHGEKVQNKAKDAGKTPQEFVDEVAEITKDLLKGLNIQYDVFARTTDLNHKRVVKNIYQKLYDQGDIYKGHYEGLYCRPCESFFTETQLIDGKCPDCGREVVPTKEEAYFLKLSNYEDKLKNHLKKNLDFVIPVERKNEIYNGFIKDGLRDLCISRTSVDWGVEIPFDKNHTSYVWIDALTNYITFLGYDIDGNSSQRFKDFWPANVQMVGKDILRFHLIYWPCILFALGEELPKQLFAHPWFLNDDKMSKSKGNILYSDDLIEKYGVDPIRLYLASELPLVSDSNISEDLIVEKFNSDLANNYGNLVNRTISMVNKYFDGNLISKSDIEKNDEDFIKTVLDTKKLVEKNIDELKFSNASKEIFATLRRCNKYIDETTPWILAKDENKKDRLSTVLYNLLEAIRICTILLESFVPETAQKVYKQLNTNLISFDSINSFGNYPLETKVGEASPLFVRIDNKAV